MRVSRAHAHAVGALITLFVFALAAGTASARPWTGAQANVVSWQSPTPAEGAKHVHGGQAPA